MDRLPRAPVRAARLVRRLDARAALGDSSKHLYLHNELSRASLRRSWERLWTVTISFESRTEQQSVDVFHSTTSRLWYLQSRTSVTISSGSLSMVGVWCGVMGRKWYHQRDTTVTLVIAKRILEAGRAYEVPKSIRALGTSLPCHKGTV